MFLFFHLQGALNLQEKVLEGDKKLNAHFGEAIAAVGDLNKDGFQGIVFWEFAFLLRGSIKYPYFPKGKGVGLKAQYFIDRYELKLHVGFFRSRISLVGRGGEVQTKKCHCGRGMDIFWNNTFYRSVVGVRLSAAGYVSVAGLLCVRIATAAKISVRSGCTLQLDYQLPAKYQQILWQKTATNYQRA